MKKLTHTLITALTAVLAFTSCNDGVTYQELRDAEIDAINNYIAKNGINVIDENTFHQQGDVTDVSKNQYVLFENTGVYMQIVSKGCGDYIKDKENLVVICRFYERNIKSDSIQARNINAAYAMYDDKMAVQRQSGTYYGTFLSGNNARSAMVNYYGTTNVPPAWLVPLRYVKIGRETEEGDKLAKVRLIVPHDQGQIDAGTRVYPCFYEIEMERGY